MRASRYDEFMANLRQLPLYHQKIFVRAIHALADENRNKVPGRPFSKAFMKFPKGDIQEWEAIMDRMGIPKSFLEVRTT